MITNSENEYNNDLNDFLSAIGRSNTKRKLMFLDTETTGIDKDDQILQIGIIYGLFDGEFFHEERRINQYINVTKEISPGAMRIHGISKEKIAKYGYINDYIDEILGYICKSDYIIGHNLNFDINMLNQDLKRIGKNVDWNNIKQICTMKETIDVLNLPGKKWPKLSELYGYLFGKAFDNSHDAMADIAATKDCFIELYKRGNISFNMNFNYDKSHLYEGDIDMYGDAIQRNQNVDSFKMESRDSFLWKEIDYCNIQEIEEMIKSGLDINARDEYGNTILMDAFHNWNIDYNGIKKIIQLGSNINARNKNGETVFMKACDNRPQDDPDIYPDEAFGIRIHRDKYHYIEEIKENADKVAILELLIQNGADINATDNSGRTSLSYACEYGKKTLAKFLMKIGGRDSRSVFTKLTSNYR